MTSQDINTSMLAAVRDVVEAGANRWDAEDIYVMTRYTTSGKVVYRAGVAGYETGPQPDAVSALIELKRKIPPRVPRARMM